MVTEPEKKKIVNVHNTAFVRNITPIDLCGKTVMWQVDLDGIYTLPFEIEPTKGGHDYNHCSPCKESIIQLTNELTKRLKGGPNQKGFPFCCTGHSNLPKIKEFKTEDFENVPNLVARKVIYTIQHFINVADHSDWYKKVSDYLEWVLLSFGQMPKDCGEPLFLSTYFFHVEDMTKRNKLVPDSKKDKILKLIKALKTFESPPATDLNILAKTYERWIGTFPFELNSYFGNMKEGFSNKLLLWDGKPAVNMYSGLSKSKIHSKESLIEALVKLTDKLLTEVNGVTLYEKGLITDANKIKLELIVNDRKAKLKQGYSNKSPDEDHRYRKIIKEWFKDEKKFFDELIPLLKTTEQPGKRKFEIKAPIISHFCCLVNESMVDIKKENETVLKYCKRICTKYRLRFTDRVRQGFSNSRNSSNIQKVKDLILPKVDQKTRDMIINYLDNKQSIKQKMYA